MELKDLVRVFVRGGIISPSDFLKIIRAMEKLGTEYLHLGSRQDILFPVKEKSKKFLNETFSSISTHFEINTFKYQNIVSSYVAMDILPGRAWLMPHTFHQILESFSFKPELRINIADPMQSLVPLFTGNINFIAAAEENFWYVFLRFPHISDTPQRIEYLVSSEDIAEFARAVQDYPSLKKEKDYDRLTQWISGKVRMNTRKITSELTLPDTNFPYYEGINRLPDGTYWLGLYWRNNKFRLQILQAIFEKCVESGIGKISLTPWKSLVIKGIQEKDRNGWERLMGRLGMNLRHSALELNWHLPALSKKALELKNYLVREMDQQDISTFGLTFTIATEREITFFTSVIIRINSVAGEEDSYDLLYSTNFNPNHLEYQPYAQEVPREILPALILELSLLYYDNIEEQLAQQMPEETDQAVVMYQCSHCLTVYDKNYGAPEAGVPAGTEFKDVPVSYCCPTCGAGKEVFEIRKVGL